MTQNHGPASVQEPPPATPAPGLAREQKRAVREQLNRIASDPIFCHSKRCTTFLQHTVTRALDESTEAIKERALGIDLFGRTPDYDTNVDPVVRVTATEVRKRLAHYYEAPGREREVHISFPRGSYVPEFYFPAETPMAKPDAGKELGARNGPRKKAWQTALTAAVLIAPYLILLGLLLGATRQTSLDRFWDPVRSAKESVLFAIPDLNAFNGAGNPNPFPWMLQFAQLPQNIERRHVVFGDALALATTTRVLGSKGVSFHVSRTEDVTLQELQQGPAVLIGGGSNYWSKQLETGRFRVTRDGDSNYITDQKNPSFRAWARPRPTPDNIGPIDYAIVTRVLSSTTGTYVYTVAGIADTGTVAAADCITDANCLSVAESMAPGNWKTANLQIVLSSTVIGGVTGKPNVLAAAAW